MSQPKQKEIAGKSYTSIPHLPCSRLGNGDHSINDAQSNYLTVKTRDKHDLVIVTEKLDGSNVAVANIDGRIVPLQRKGYGAWTSPFLQHRMFAQWVVENESLFGFLAPGERVCGEWIAQAHGTLYDLESAPGGSPFIAFDLIDANNEKVPYGVFLCRCAGTLVVADTLHVGAAISVEKALAKLEPKIHGAVDPIEGVVYRMIRQNKVDYLAKFVHHFKQDGKYLFLQEPVWNWHPNKSKVWKNLPKNELDALMKGV